MIQARDMLKFEEKPFPAIRKFAEIEKFDVL
jgi:hypothetical protein